MRTKICLMIVNDRENINSDFKVLNTGLNYTITVT